MFLAVCPGFQQQWQEHLDWWAGKEAGTYLDVAEFARYLVDSYEQGKTSEFDAVFGILERILNEGNQEAREIGEIGLIEDLQTIGSHRSWSVDVFKKWLGPQSLASWAAIEKIWEGKSSLMDVLRAERSDRD